MSIGLSRAAGRIGYALLTASLYYSNVGMASNLIFAPLLDGAMIQAQTLDDRRGLLPPTQSENDRAAITGMLTAMPPTMVPNPEELLPGNFSLVRELSLVNSSRNIHILYWVSPRLSDLEKFPVYPSEIVVNGVAEPILSVARPDRYPELYQTRNWNDPAHLNERGAAIMSRELAKQLRAWYERHPQSMACEI